ncbi:hypothetical protein FMM05_20215 [Flavobacterium zepuense]|uniref:Uncharacterized protein n=2 Tax=Flavobacterium zepuense TaxID=2593302 RepID=A0A552UTG2_9FLAO|nr:hypothetical protein FMM05_20215 [Flavobacterium zepuense]
MMTANVVAQVFDTILSTPGMNDVVKIDLKISRKDVLLLNAIIEKGLSDKGDDKTGILANVPADDLQKLKSLADEALQKASLVELSQRLSELDSVK